MEKLTNILGYLENIGGIWSVIVYCLGGLVSICTIVLLCADAITACTSKKTDDEKVAGWKQKVLGVLSFISTYSAKLSFLNNRADAKKIAYFNETLKSAQEQLSAQSEKTESADVKTETVESTETKAKTDEVKAESTETLNESTETKGE